MKTIQVTVELYKLNELSNEVRGKVIKDHMHFLSNDYDDVDIEIHGSIKEYWNSITEESAIESIEVNEYLYYSDGNIANVVHYCGKHERSGEQVLTFDNKEYIINK